MQEMWVRFLSPEDLLEKEMATHFSILTWKIPGTEEPGGLTVHEIETELDMTEQLNSNTTRQGMY